MRTEPQDQKAIQQGTDHMDYQCLILGWHWQFSPGAWTALRAISIKNFQSVQNLALSVQAIIGRGNGRWELRYKNVPLYFVVEENVVMVTLAGE